MIHKHWRWLCNLIGNLVIGRARKKYTAKIHISAKIVTECAHDIIERVPWHHWKLSSYACLRNNVNFMMEEWTENPRTTLIKHGKMSFDADFRDNLIDSWFEAEMLSTNTFLHEASNKKLFFFSWVITRCFCVATYFWPDIIAQHLLKISIIHSNCSCVHYCDVNLWLHSRN